MSEWQPIESAPKGLQWILLGYFPDYLEGTEQGGRPSLAYWDGGAWKDCCGKRLRVEGAFSPTHWAPLPQPPETKA